MDNGARALGWLQKAVLGVFVVAICAGIFLPVYTDEVGWRFQERAALDGVDKLFSDVCGPNTLAVPPFFMMPVRAYSAFFNTAFADPLYVRLSGVGYALFWAVLVLALIRRVSATPAEKRTLATLGFGLLCLGTMPLLLVWSRPEQPIVIAATAALLLAWKSGDRAAEAATRTAWLRSVAVVLLAVIAFSYHLKALFLTPVFLACLFFTARGRAANLPRLVMAGVLIVLAGWSAHYWVHRLSCPGDPVLAAEYARNSMGLKLAASRDLSEVASAIGRIIGNTSLLAYFGLPTPRPDPLSSWLAPRQIGVDAAFLWFRALILVWSAAVLLAVISIGARVRTAWRARRLDARTIAFGAMLVGVLGWSATQVARNVYEASFVLPLVAVAVVLALSGREPGGRLAAWADLLARIVGIGAIASVLAVAAIYAPSIARANGQTAYIRAQPHSLPVFGYASVKPDIIGAAAKCGIGDPHKARALMIDDLTYFAFMESRLPQQHLGVLGTWKGSITDPVAYLRSRGSSGAVLGCHLLPEDLRQRAKSQGRFCCLGPPNW